MLFLLQTMSDEVPRSFTSVGGIITTSLIITEAAKRIISEKTPIINKIPVILFPLISSGILVFLANKVFKTNDGKPFLPGNVYSLAISALSGAAGASGLFSWLKDGTTNVGQSRSIIPGGTPVDNPQTAAIKATTKVPLLLIPLLAATMLASSGCQQKQSPSANLALQGETLTAVFNIVSDARDSGLLTQTQINEAKPFVKAYMNARQAAEAQIIAGGDPSTIDNLVQQANAAWLVAAPYVTKLKAATPATQPTH